MSQGFLARTCILNGFAEGGSDGFIIWKNVDWFCKNTKKNKNLKQSEPKDIFKTTQHFVF